MAEDLDDGEFWLPSQFLTDDDILMDFKSDFGTGTASASASTSDLTSLTSDDDDILLPSPTRELSGSPQSTLCGWPTGPVSPLKEHLNDSVSVSVSEGNKDDVDETDSKDNATLDLLNKAAREVAKININNNDNNCGKIGTGFFDCSNTGKRLSCPPPIQQRPLLFYPPPFYSHPQFRRFPPHMTWGPVRYVPTQQIQQSRVNKGSNASNNGNGKANNNNKTNSNGNNSERPLGLPPSAWPPLPGQAQTQAQQPEPQPQAQPNMGMFVGHKFASVGTGVFLPRRVSTADQKKKSVGNAKTKNNKGSQKRSSRPTKTYNLEIQLPSKTNKNVIQLPLKTNNDEIQLPPEWVY